MRTTLLFTVLTLVLHLQGVAQQSKVRNIKIKNIAASDSIHIPFNADYYLIEDSCAQIIRQTRFSPDRKFYGTFRDVRRTNPEQVMASGTYTPEGLKTGLFTVYYANGKERATGNYEQNELTGTWKLFYESGNPKLIFMADKGKVTILDAWDENGKQLVTQGTGSYTTKIGSITWSGKLLNGKPEGTWRASNFTAGTTTFVLTEKYKNGEFVSGSGPLGTYKDAPRIVWVNPLELPYLTAERMNVSFTPCGVAYKTGAYYRNGAEAFSEEIKKQVSDYLKNVNLKPYENELNIEGEIAEDGRIINFTYRNAFNDRIASGIVSALRKLPSLEPARADGKPITQKFEIKFAFHSGVYRFNYRFMPL
ncbi:toxin-antitoxin system YwqK family antitoxin [Pontibacter fetidus]|uniref:MORN repeat variant n=1 Tax=Pontibacter fetidus TaxID=2700082 RepID=A0A6B2H3B9_9BACT|nr:hypothetical protein [Pontibacter fetidus]NDK57595.1 hypothetical protein [Pontibacter fetidus]